MSAITRKVYWKSIVTASLFLLFALVGTNTVLAADQQGVNGSADTYTAKSHENTTAMADAAEYILSLLGPGEACAKTDVTSCKDYCADWDTTNVCCRKWKDDTPEECNALTCKNYPQ